MGADDFLLEITPEPQEQTFWCWAAVSTMAAHSFDIDVDGSPVSQLDIVKFEDLKIKTDAQRQNKVDELADSTCGLDNSNCDRPGDTWLYCLDGTKPPAGRVIKKERLIEEITDRNRPVILKWDYNAVSQQTVTQKDLPGGEHYVIITGYDPTEDKFRVFNPWKGSHSSSGGHEHWVSYAGYLVPKVNLGLEVFAKHRFDVFNLKNGTGKLVKAKKGSPFLTTQPPVAQVLLKPTSFDNLAEAVQVVGDLIAKRVVLTRDRQRITEPLSMGRLYPIVAIRTAQLVRASKQPDTLLAKPLTSSVIATVTKAATGEIVDSILLYHEADGWKESEYSNTLITQLMENVQANHPVREGSEAHFRSYYLVSIPELGEFFAAQGLGANALLATLDNDARGELVPAHVALGAVVKKVGDASKRIYPKIQRPKSRPRSKPRRR